ncbi:MAG TPA: hypothetical protein VMY77_14465 [Chitinophagaceae bacterium]|nr:hypothetical protein [Chitinophagaceae bacterium]
MVNQLFLKPDEGKFLSLCVVSMLEHIRGSLKDEKLNWTPASRKDMKDIIAAGDSLRIKLKKLGFDMRDLPGLEPGEEKDYFTKES